jgi:uncharacterized membrane protein YgcG
MTRTKRARFRRRITSEPILTETQRQELADVFTAWWLEAEQVLQPGVRVDGRASAVRERYSSAALTARLEATRPELAVADQAALRTRLAAFVSWTLSYEARQLKILLGRRAGDGDPTLPADLPPELIAELRDEARNAVTAVERRTEPPDPYVEVRRELSALVERGSAWQAAGASDGLSGGFHGGSHGGGHHGSGVDFGGGDFGGGGDGGGS